MTRALALALAAAVALGGAAPALAGRAGLVVRREGARVRSGPRAGAATIVVLRAGERVKVVQRRPGWVKVRVRRTIGWLPAADVGRVAARAAQATPAAKTTRRAGAKTPAPALAAPGAQDRADGWRSGLMADASGGAVAAPAPAVVVAPAVAARAPRGAGLELRAGVGVATQRSVFSSDGVGGVANHRVDGEAFALELGGGFARGAGALLVGLDASAALFRDAPGIHYTAPDGATEDIAVSSWRYRAALLAGWRGRGGAHVVARAGYAYDFTDVSDLMNLATMAREVRRGPIAGLAIAAPRVVSGALLRAQLDLLVGGALKQTEGLQDGAPASIFAARALAGLAIALGPRSRLLVDYRLDVARTTFVGPSPRHAGLTRGERDERGHALLVAVGWSL